MWGVLCRLTIGLTFLKSWIKLMSCFGGSGGRWAGWLVTAFIAFFTTLWLIVSSGSVKAADVAITAATTTAEPGRYVMGAPASSAKWTSFVGVSDTGAPANVSMRCETTSDLTITFPKAGWYRVEAYNGGYPFFGGNSQALRLTWTGPGDPNALPNAGGEMVFSQTNSWSWEIVSGFDADGHLGRHFQAGTYTVTAATAFSNESFWLCGWRVTSVEFEPDPPPDDGGGGGDPGGGDPGDGGGGGGGGTPGTGPTGGDCWWWNGSNCWPKRLGGLGTLIGAKYSGQSSVITGVSPGDGIVEVFFKTMPDDDPKQTLASVRLGRNGFIEILGNVDGYYFENGDVIRNATWGGVNPQTGFESAMQTLVADHMDSYSAALAVPRTADQSFDGGTGSGSGSGSGGDDQVPTGEDPDEDGDGCPKSRDPDDNDAAKKCSSPRDLLDSSYLNIKSRVKRDLGLDGSTIESKEGTFALQVPWVDGSNKTFNMTNKVESTTPGGSVLETFRAIFRAFQILLLGVSTWESVLLTLRQW